MIKRIISRQHFNKAVDDITEYLQLNEESNNYYHLLPNNVDTLKKAFGHDKMFLGQNIFSNV